MSYDLTLDFDRLLAPISDGLPCGESRENSSSIDLSRAFSVVLGEWQAAKKMEKEWAEAQLLFVGRDDSLRHGDWQAIAEKAIDFLRVHSKDTRILMCLVEAMTHLNGFNGLQQSLSLVRQMLEKYADSLNPRPESSEDSAPFDSISSNLDRSKTFFDAVQLAPLSSASEYKLVSQFHFDLSKFFDGASMDEVVKGDLIAKGQMTDDRFRQLFNRVPKGDLVQTQNDIVVSLSEAKAVNALLRQHCADTSAADVSITKTIQLIEKVQTWFNELTSSKLKGDVPVVAGSNSSNQGVTQSASGNGAGPSMSVVEGQLQNREQALEQLLRVAEYFRKTEPHSPVSYALEQAVRWGRMPLPQFLEEVLRNDEALAEVYRRIGFKPAGN